jgi:hypothetical protein
MPKFLYLIGVIFLAFVINGCANMNNKEQRAVSGAAVGGTIGGLPGAGIGALTGYFVHLLKENDDKEK